MVRKEPQRAARLLGAAAVLFESQRDLYAADRIAFDRDVATARAHLGEAAFAAAWAAGQAMTLEPAIAYALEGSTTAMEATLSEQMDDSDMTQPRQTASQPVIDPLTTRELDILHLLSDGLNSREIAEQLVLSVGTVRWYLKQIYSKLDVHGRSEAIVRAKALNMLP